MAAITATQVLIDRGHGADRKYWRIRYVWDNGDYQDVDCFVPGATDQAAWIAARKPELEAAAAQAEIARLLGDS